ncbi:MAG: flagellar hook basal-body protein [Gammaproteobacteria bacterium]|nr:flagellar hook basal-body protein [Gammaproteobacteria bacterium]
MTDVFTISELSMLNDMRQLDIISHNLANVTTQAYKRDIPVMRSFAEQLQGDMSLLDITVANTGYTVPAISTSTAYTQGAFTRTGNALDVAIEGDAFFEFNTGKGMVYSRQGSFQLDAAGRLVSSDGHSVNGFGGQIRLGSDNPRIDRDGIIWDGEDAVEQLKLVRFRDPTSLIKVGNGDYQLGEGSRAEILQNPSLRQGFVEASNVEVMREMVHLMTTVRHFGAIQSVIRGYDEILGTAIETIAEF